MKALSIRQPWAWLIVNVHKDIENRSWPTKYRGRVLIHAGKGMTRLEYDECYALAEEVGDPAIIFPRFDALARGGIVGAATITDCVTQSDSSWFMGSHGFVLQDQRTLPFIECKGALGFFDVPVDVSAQLRQMHDLGAIS